MQSLARSPMVGLFPFLIVFVVQGLGHTLMVGMESIFGEQYVLQSAFVLGLAGAILLFIGMPHDSEVAGTGCGFRAFYLLSRLLRMWKVTTAIRYSIPTAIIASSSYEIAGRWNLSTDIGVHPERFGVVSNTPPGEPGLPSFPTSRWLPEIRSAPISAC